MNIVYYLLLIIAILLLLLLHGRVLYQRSVHSKNRKEMENVFTNISHELLTPLTVISASVEHLHEVEPNHATEIGRAHV